MNLAFTKTPKFVRWFFHKRIWAFSHANNSVYLTFDDGPIPLVTPWVLEQLKKHQAKATFFCIGDNIKKHPEIFKQVVQEGHVIGNHTQHHLNGWQTPITTYLEDITGCEHIILKQTSATNIEVSQSQSHNHKATISSLFRPPYGKMTSKQAKKVLEKGYEIIMWDILSKDYDKTVTPETCLKNVLEYVKPGSIIVFHDSLKAEKNLRFVLPKILAHIRSQGWTCKKITNTKSF